MSGPTDILGVGCVAVDDLVYVEDYPAADSKTQITERERQCGGLTATALVAAARLGARCSVAVTLGDDELSRFVLDRLQQEGIRRSAGLLPSRQYMAMGFCGHTTEWPRCPRSHRQITNRMPWYGGLVAPGKSAQVGHDPGGAGARGEREKAVNFACLPWSHHNSWGGHGLRPLGTVAGDTGEG
jgi:hypothetical protein